MRTEFPLGVRLFIAIGVIAAVIALVAVVIITSTAASGQQLTASFGRAGQGLSALSPVKIRGVTVGRVRSVELDKQGRAEVSFEVDDAHRIPRNVTAAVEPLSAFGPKMINLRLDGTDEKTGPFLASGDRVRKTADPTDLGDTLGEAYAATEAVDPVKVGKILKSIAQGVRGEGPKLRKIIDNSQRLLDVAESHQQDNDRYGVISSLADARGTPGDSTDAFVGTTGDLNAFIPPVADESDNFNRVLDRITSVSSTTGAGLDRHWGDVRRGFRSGERLSVLLFDQLDNGGEAVRGIDHSVKVLTDSARIPGPGDTNLLGIQGWIDPNPCNLIIDLPGCPRQGRG